MIDISMAVMTVFVPIVAPVTALVPPVQVAVAAVLAKMVSAFGMVTTGKPSAVVVVIHAVAFLVALIRLVVAYRGVAHVGILVFVAPANIVPEALVCQAIPFPGAALAAQVIIVSVAVVGTGVVVAVRVIAIVRRIGHAIGIVLSATISIGIVFSAVLGASYLVAPLRKRIAVIGVGVEGACVIKIIFLLPIPTVKAGVYGIIPAIRIFSVVMAMHPAWLPILVVAVFISVVSHSLKI
jgi:hypothetical protein